jgi:peptidoglycan/xylan/chitin deacetylase (PgdA/CDA1 family)
MCRRPSFFGLVVLGLLAFMLPLLVAGCTGTPDPSVSAVPTTASTSGTGSSTTTAEAVSTTASAGSGTTGAASSTTTEGRPQTSAGRKVAYLTFDDGPSERTSELLAVLKEDNVTATFFVIGTLAKKYPGILKEMVSDGHAVGVHSWTHDYSYVYKNTDNFLADFKKLRDYIAKETGVTPDVCRFPGGTNNTVYRHYSGGHIMKSIVKLVENLGFTYYDWNVSSAEASSPPPDKEKIVSNVVSQCKKKDIAVILFHDADNQDYVDAVPEIIAQLRAMGFTFQTLSPDNPPKAKHGLVQFKPA